MSAITISEQTKVINHVLETKNNGACAQLAVIDTLGWGHATILLLLGSLDTTVDGKVEESADNSAWEDVDGTTITQLGADDDDKIVAIELDLDDRERYLRCLPTVGDATGAAVAVVAILSDRKRTAEDEAEAQFDEQIEA